MIDVGTNNIQLLIAERTPEINVLFRKTDVTAFGKGIINQHATKKAIINLKKWLSHYLSIAHKYTDNIIIVGTSGARTANNSHEIQIWLEQTFKLSFHIISGETEAYLNAVANIDDFTHSNLVFFDVGGGSTEFSYVTDKTITKLDSIQLGIRFLLNRFGEDLNIQKKHVHTVLQNVQIPDHDFELIGIGGTVTSLAALQQKLTVYQNNLVHGYKLTKSELELLLVQIQRNEISLPASLPGIRKRSDIMVFGTMIVLEIIKHFQKKSILISDKGLQFGVLKLTNDELKDLFYHGK